MFRGITHHRFSSVVRWEMSKPIRCVFRSGKAKVRARRRKANARERARMRHLNEMFDRLRELMPILGQLGIAERTDALRKISKIDTLHLARNYIALLTAILEGGNSQRRGFSRSSASGSAQPLDECCERAYAFSANAFNINVSSRAATVSRRVTYTVLPIDFIAFDCDTISNKQVTRFYAYIYSRNCRNEKSCHTLACSAEVDTWTGIVSRNLNYVPNETNFSLTAFVGRGSRRGKAPLLNRNE